MKKHLWLWNRISVKLTFLLLSCSVIPLLVLSLLISRAMFKELQNNVNVLYQQTIDEVALSISLNVQPFIDLLNYNAKRESIADIISGNQSTETQQNLVYEQLKSELLDYAAVNRVGYPYYYLVISRDGIEYTNFSVQSPLDTSVLESSWYQELYAANYKTIWIGTVENTSGRGHNDRLYIAGNIFDGMENVGVLVHSINIAFLEKLLGNAAYSDKSSLFILDDENNCIAEGDGNLFSYKEIEAVFCEDRPKGDTLHIKNTEYLLKEASMFLSYVDADWRIVSITPIYDIYREIGQYNMITMALAALLLLLIAVILYHINRNYVIPVVHLYQAMREVKKGNLDVRINVNRHDEIGEVLHGFDTMVQSLQDNILKIQNEEKQKHKLELIILQEQIRPHFVSNTLNTIRVMAELRGASGVSTALTSFMHLIDYYFRDTDSLSTLREEMVHLREYMYLQNLRYQNQFEMTEEIDEKMYKYSILKLTLQPLVENCIKHGFLERGRQGHIRIAGILEENRIRIDVTDDGEGMTQECLAHIFSEEELMSGQSEHKGIANIHRRIRIHFGEEYGISAVSQLGIGTTVTLLLPCIEQKT